MEPVRRALEAAIESDSAGDKQHAALAVQQYKLACELALAELRKIPPTNNAERARMLTRVREWLERAELLQAKLVLDRAPGRHLSPINVEGVDDDGIVGMRTVKQVLREAILLPAQQPQLFQGATSRAPWRSLLLFGPPGTGKTSVVEALCIKHPAFAAACEFVSIRPSDLMSKYAGDSEKQVRRVFEQARRRTLRGRTVVFIDEIDFIGVSRRDGGGGSEESYRRVLTELLRQMDGVVISSQSENAVLVIGATNLPHRLDSALRRRFERRIYVPLPSQVERAQLIATRLGPPSSDGMHALRWQDVARLAGSSLTEGFSGADLSALCNDILLRPVQHALQATRFRQTWDGYLVPSDSWIGTRMRMMDPGFDASKLRLPPATWQDVQYVLEHRPPRTSVGAHEQAQLVEFCEQFGERQDAAAADEEEAMRLAVQHAWGRRKEEENTGFVASAYALAASLLPSSSPRQRQQQRPVLD